MSDYIYVPWNQEQVRLLNMLQKSGRCHPYTCGGGGGPCSGVELLATPDGWVCPQCGQVQTDVLKAALSLAEMLDEKDWPNWRGHSQKQRIEAELEKGI